MKHLMCALEPNNLTNESRRGVGTDAEPTDYRTTALRGNDLPRDCAQAVGLPGFPGTITYN